MTEDGREISLRRNTSLDAEFEKGLGIIVPGRPLRKPRGVRVAALGKLRPIRLDRSGKSEIYVGKRQPSPGGIVERMKDIRNLEAVKRCEIVGTLTRDRTLESIDVRPLSSCAHQSRHGAHRAGRDHII